MSRIIGREGVNPRNYIQGGGSSNPTVQRRVMGNFPFYLEDTGIFPPQGGPTSGKY